MSWESQGTQRQHFPNSFELTNCMCKCIWCFFFFELLFYISSCEFISFFLGHSSFICQCGLIFIALDFVEVTDSIDVRPSICPELIGSQTISIEFNLVSKIQRKMNQKEIEFAIKRKATTTTYSSQIRIVVKRDIFSYFKLIFLSHSFFLSMTISFIWALNLTADFSLCNMYPTLYGCIWRIWNEKGKVEKNTYTHTHTAMRVWRVEKCCRKIRRGEIAQAERS